MRRAALLACALCAALSCAGAGLMPREHPLAGRIWDTAQRRYVDAAEAERRIAAAQVALLGETHDNPEHHAIQLRILHAIVAAGKHPALAMEQMDTDRQAAVDAALARDATAADIARAAHVSRGWDWIHYAPLVEFAIAERLPLVALNMPRAGMQGIMRAGLSSLGEGEPERLGLTRTWHAERNTRLRREIVAGHCGEDGPLTAKLVEVQRARDAVMADRILAHDARGVVAILGRGHARADLGVPLYLAARAPSLGVLSLGIVEVDDEARKPDDYPEAARGLFDLVWFTPAVERDDPCAPFEHRRPAPAPQRSLRASSR